MKFNIAYNAECDFCNKEKPVLTVVNNTCYICRECSRIINQKSAKHSFDYKQRIKKGAKLWK